MSYKTITIQVGKIRFDMIRIEGGELEIRTVNNLQTSANKNGIPAHIINLPTFYIGKFPVTQNLWEAVMGYNHSYNQSLETVIANDSKFRKIQQQITMISLNAGHLSKNGDSEFDSDQGHYPAENISYNEAKKFVRKLSEMTGLKFDIPTEEEWEYAARGGQMSQNYIYAGSNNIDDVAWYRRNSGLKTHPVGEKQSNELGLYDMCGNVWEWTDSKPSYPDKANNIDKEKTFIRRGGSVFHVDKNCKVSFRYNKKRNESSPGSGMRIVIRDNTPIVQQSITIHNNPNEIKEHVNLLMNDLKKQVYNKTFKVFIAGAKKLKNERSLLREELCKVENTHNLDIRSLTFEDFATSLTGADRGRQADYNKFIEKEANVVIFIFDSEAGEITEEEFDIAYNSLKENRHPDIFVYVRKRSPFSLRNLFGDKRLQNIKNKIFAYQKEYYIEYENLENLRYLFYSDMVSYFIKEEKK